ncbi:MAG TPA: cell division protein ZapE [Paraburkholderia sp.]|jgi:cell division protein ZapE
MSKHTDPLLTEYFAEKNTVLDASQRNVATALEALYRQAQRSTGWFPQRPSPLGAYLWGRPGRGKTMLMDALFSRSVMPARRTHYHQFLRDLHNELGRSNEGCADHLRALASRVAEQCRLFCLDEFHLHDVADTILMERFLTVLLEHGVLVVLTSNYAPGQLLPDPLLHRHALGLIALVERNMRVLNLDSDTDYRYRERATLPQYLHPCGDAANESLRRLLAELRSAPTAGPGIVHLCDRSVPACSIGEHYIWFTFDVICVGPRSHLDYLELSERWDIVVVSDIRQCQMQNTDALRRFIWLVDVLYDRRRRLLLASELPIEAMLSEATPHVDTQRTQSRLAEMQSASFAASAPAAMSPLCQ